MAAIDRLGMKFLVKMFDETLAIATILTMVKKLDQS